ncbi:MAG: hypothetical protein R3E01_35285 [Pirellulaceae bacterium]
MFSLRLFAHAALSVSFALCVANVSNAIDPTWSDYWYPSQLEVDCVSIAMPDSPDADGDGDVDEDDVVILDSIMWDIADFVSEE